MIREADVNEAMIQQAAEELEIGVPIRAWRVEGEELVLCLAYGGEARWREADEGNDRSTVPWRFDQSLRAEKRRKIPSGDLRKKRRQTLLNVALDWGFQSESDYVSKAELVEAIGWLILFLEENDGD